MKTYIVTFGNGDEAVSVIERNCVSFAECVIRLEFTGFIMTEISKIEIEE